MVRWQWWAKSREKASFESIVEIDLRFKVGPNRTPQLYSMFRLALHQIRLETHYKLMEHDYVLGVVKKEQ